MHELGPVTPHRAAPATAARAPLHGQHGARRLHVGERGLLPGLPHVVVPLVPVRQPSPSSRIRCPCHFFAGAVQQRSFLRGHPRTLATRMTLPNCTMCPPCGSTATRTTSTSGSMRSTSGRSSSWSSRPPLQLCRPRRNRHQTQRGRAAARAPGELLLLQEGSSRARRHEPAGWGGGRRCSQTSERRLSSQAAAAATHRSRRRGGRRRVSLFLVRHTTTTSRTHHGGRYWRLSVP